MNDALADLKPIILPDAPGFWPLAPGWWALIILVIALSCAIVYWFKRKPKAARLKKQLQKIWSADIPARQKGIQANLVLREWLFLRNDQSAYNQQQWNVKLKQIDPWFASPAGQHFLMLPYSRHTASTADVQLWQQHLTRACKQLEQQK